MRGGGHCPRLRLSSSRQAPCLPSRHAAAARWMCSQGGGSRETRNQYVERVTIKWVKDVIVGLRLCPWANSVLVDGGIRVVVSDAEEEDVMLGEIREEMRALAALPGNGPNATTLIVTDRLFDDFFDYNMFVGRIEEEIDRLEVREHLQLATFHPDYQFGDTSKGDPANWTNRSPFPIFHLLVIPPPSSPLPLHDPCRHE